MRIHPVAVVIAVPVLAAGILMQQSYVYARVPQPSSEGQNGRSVPSTNTPGTESPVSGFEGSTWNYHGNDEEYIFRFDPQNVLYCAYTSGSFYSNATWKRDGDSIYIEFNNGYAKYHGQISGSHMEGTASNVGGLQWAWTAEQRNPPRTRAAIGQPVPSTSAPPSTNRAPNQESRAAAVTLHLTKAKILWKGGQIQEAINECNAALRLEPGSQEAISLRDKYQKAQALLNGTNQ